MKQWGVALIVAMFCSSIPAHTVEVKMRTGTYWGQHGPKNCMAVWVLDKSFNYIRTFFVSRCSDSGSDLPNS